MGNFWHCSCVFFIHYNAFTVWFPVHLHWTQRWCRWESYDSSISWLSSLKNAKRPKLFRKFQFCFFSLTTLIIYCELKNIYHRAILAAKHTQVLQSFLVSESPNVHIFTSLSIHFALVNFIIELFDDFLSAKIQKSLDCYKKHDF